MVPLRIGERAWRWGGSTAAAMALSTSLSFAESSDRLGETGPIYLPIPAPSTDTAPQEFVMKGGIYRIPRNYITTTGDQTKSPGVVSMEALLPDLSARSKDNAHCFLNREDPCHAEIVTIGLTDDALPHSGAWRLQSVQGISHPDKRIGPCGLEYYEGLGSVERGNIVFEMFFTQFSGDSDLSLARCPKEGSPMAPVCDAKDNVGNGNGFYYIFPRSRLCGWGDIKHRILDLLKSFQKRGG